MTLLLFGVRQVQMPPLEQLKVPAGQSPTTPHCLHVLLTQVGVDPPQLPQTWVPPQPLGTVPQFLPEQAAAGPVGVQPQTFGVPPPAQLCGEVQLPQV
jgi:hypothetical protein